MDYIEAFKKLKTNNKYSRKSPHKAILLLTIIEMYETNVISKNEIKYDDVLNDVFLRVWNRILPDESVFFPDAYFPFWFLQSDKFWHIIPVKGKEEILNDMKDGNSKPTELKIKNCVKYAELDDDLYFLMTIPSGRASLKRALLETYSTYTDEVIDKLCNELNHNKDLSTSAMYQFEQMKSTSKEDTPNNPIRLNNDLESHFKSLSDDLQIALNLEYYSFLKKHRYEREQLKEVCPTVYHLLDRLTNHPVNQKELEPSFTFTYENFLTDLKYSIMGEDNSMNLVDNINVAIKYLSDDTAFYPTVQEIIEEDSGNTELNILPNDEISTSSHLIPLSPAQESRKGMPWTDSEEELITLYHKQGYTPAEIALAMGRSDTSIKMRLSNLGLIDYSYEDDLLSKFDQFQQENTLEFSVDNSAIRCSILNKEGKRVYTTDGKFKIFNGKPYRFNYKSMCFTIKDMVQKDGHWSKGTKKLVAYSYSDLFPLIDEFNFIDHVEEFVEGELFEQNKILFDGKWYGYDGRYISDNDINNNGLHLRDSTKDEDEKTLESFDFVPKGRFKSMDEVVTSSYDYLWLLSIIDFMSEKRSDLTLKFDEISCMMIAKAWSILNDSPQLKEKEKSLVECIEFLIDESKEYMDTELNWNSPKDVIYDTIKDYPMSGVFEDLVDELVEKSPINVLKAWIPSKNYEDFMIDSLNFSYSCLYALHFKKIDSYIDINPNWKYYLYNENDNLDKYFTLKYIQHLSE